MQSSVQQEFQPFGLCQGKNKIFKKYIHKSSEQFPTSTLSPTPSLYNNKQRRSLNFSGSHQNKKKKKRQQHEPPLCLIEILQLAFHPTFSGMQHLFLPFTNSAKSIPYFFTNHVKNHPATPENCAPTIHLT